MQMMWMWMWTLIVDMVMDLDENRRKPKMMWRRKVESGSSSSLAQHSKVRSPGAWRSLTEFVRLCWSSLGTREPD